MSRLLYVYKNMKLVGKLTENHGKFFEFQYEKDAEPISLGILKNYDDYIDSLNDFKEGDFETIIKVILNSSLEVTPKIYSIIEELLLLKEKWSNNIKLRKDSFSWIILDELILNQL